jgi:hypothetical protein
VATVQQALDIMGEFYHVNRQNENWTEFFSVHDLTFPLSYLYWVGMATPQEAASPYITETWKAFCAVFDIDYHASFDSLDEFDEFLIETEKTPKE